MGLLCGVLDYIRFLKNAFKYNIKLSILFSQLIDDFYLLGIKSLVLISLLSFSIGFVTSFQLITMMKGIYMPDILLVAGIKNTIFLEFAPTILCFIFIGRNVTALCCNIFDNRRSGYYDKYKVTGINIVSFSSLSKIITCTLCYPLLTVFSCFFSLIGAYIYCVLVGNMSQASFIDSLVSYINKPLLNFCFFKSVIFGFLVGSIGSYLGLCYYKDNKEIISVSQHCFTVICIVMLFADIFLNTLKPLFLIYK